MADRLVEIADGFWNIRGSFKTAKVLDIGTQSSLARLSSGGFALLDCYTLQGEVEARVLELTDQGRAIEAIVNLHPFHTVHVKRVAARFPEAKLYGTERHRSRAPQLPWQALRTETAAFHDHLAADFAFTVPRGVHFVAPDPRLHFSSVLAVHRATRTLHVDDTLSYTKVPVVGGLRFHPSLKGVLERRPGAVADFRTWTEELVALCAEVDHVCTAHARPLPPSAAEGGPIADRVRGAIASVDRMLDRHERKHG